MNITLHNAGKRFNRDWIFRSLSYTFEAGKKYAITGPNGSGKSTLLQVLGGSMATSDGSIEWQYNGRAILADAVYHHIAIAAPYLEVIEEMTATEFLVFHSVFKQLVLPAAEILEVIGLSNTSGKQIRNFSSGMRQRIKLAQAIFSDVAVVLLDEPCTNLDAAGYALYHRLVNQYCTNKMVIVSSNDLNEYDFCEERINVMDFK